ncbi:MAG TPA: M15 family metallopeptidase [Xanthomonadales bacterium]|nr:M15 family metallopeptidase [Xanthomonadales bacterium]
MANPQTLRLNAASHELLVRRTRGRADVELRRKRDGAVLARGAGRTAVVLVAHPAGRAEANRALRALAPLAAGAGLRLSLAVRARGRAPARSTKAPIALPADYGATRGLERMHEPRVLRSIGRDRYGREAFLAPAAARAWSRMRAAARSDGIELELVSAFRSAAYQAALVARKVAAGRTLEDVLAANAAPGYSEHHAGRAIDVSTPGSRPLEEEFETTDAFRWLASRAGEFGFRMSFARGNRHGISYEPWHWCYSRGWQPPCWRLLREYP